MSVTENSGIHPIRPGWVSLVIADISLIWGAYLLYVFNNWYGSFLSGSASLILLGTALGYTCVSIFKHVHRRNDADPGKAYGYLFFAVLRRLVEQFLGNPASRDKIFANRQEQVQFLFILVKLFFIPVMIQFSVGNYHDLEREISRASQLKSFPNFFIWFNNLLFPIAITFFFLLDTLLFCFGYLVSSRKLRNEVRSVDSSWSGWLVTLACYPPFNDMVSGWAPHYSSNYVYFFSIEATFIIRVLVVILLFFYVFASISLGAKCSNLTNRGIVQTGAYRLVRHPAYISKVLVWWITLIPVIVEKPASALGMLVWTSIYFMRAVTEERHLLQDPEYQAYCNKVKYRFIPGVY